MEGIQMQNFLRNRLRSFTPWIKFQELNREGWIQAYRRSSIQKWILHTRPLSTATKGPTEVHLLTWRRDWLNALWALKSFYYYSKVDYPIVIHDGGLEDWQVLLLKEHLPNARIHLMKESNAFVENFLIKNGLTRCVEYRRLNVATKKVFDFFLLSESERIISIDSDIVFFKRPDELIQPVASNPKNTYNKDMQYAYSMSLDELETSFGIRPPPLINSGLSRVERASIDFKKIETWLANKKFSADRWVTEQTIHALCSTLHGVELLPDSYLVSTSEGLNEHLKCKHYPGFFRPLLYSEGMGFLKRNSLLFSDWAN